MTSNVEVVQWKIVIRVLRMFVKAVLMVTDLLTLPCMDSSVKSVMLRTVEGANIDMMNAVLVNGNGDLITMENVNLVRLIYAIIVPKIHLFVKLVDWDLELTRLIDKNVKNVSSLTVLNVKTTMRFVNYVPMALESKMEYVSNVIKQIVCNVLKIIQFVRNALKEML